MADYYWYDKYEVVPSWTKDPAEEEQVMDSKYLFSGDNVIEDTPDTEGEFMYSPYGSYEINPYATYGDYESKHFEMVESLTYSEAWARGHIYVISEKRQIDGHEVVLEVLRGYLTYQSNGRYYWIADKRYKLFDYDKPLSEWPKVYNVGVKGDLLETDLIKPNTYPVDGIQDGYWWVRKEPYTYPPPILISPENAYILRLDEKAEVPYFVFELQERFEGNDNNLYQVRTSFGFNSDYTGDPVIYESAKDNSVFEYSTDGGSTWQAFPSEGVPALSWVRIKPPAENFEFGFYYWTATAYGQEWGYGRRANPRLLIVITDTDDVYFLTINGKRYLARDIKVIESSNGEVSNIRLELLNNNI